MHSKKQELNERELNISFWWLLLRRRLKVRSCELECSKLSECDWCISCRCLAMSALDEVMIVKFISVALDIIERLMIVEIVALDIISELVIVKVIALNVIDEFMTVEFVAIDNIDNLELVIHCILFFDFDKFIFDVDSDCVLDLFWAQYAHCQEIEIFWYFDSEQLCWCVGKTGNLAGYFEADLEHKGLRFTNLALRLSRSTRLRSRQTRGHENQDIHARDQRDSRSFLRALKLILILAKTIRELSQLYVELYLNYMSITCVIACAVASAHHTRVNFAWIDRI